MYRFGPYPSTHRISFPVADAASIPLDLSGEDEAIRPRAFEVGEEPVTPPVARRAAAEASEEAVPKMPEPEGDEGPSRDQLGRINDAPRLTGH